MGTARYLIAATALLAAAVIACDRSPTGPSLPGVGANNPPPVFTNRLEIVGPSFVAPGQQSQFTAIGHRTDGSTEDMTQRVAWTSFRTNVLTVSGGLATGMAVGDSILQVRLNSLASTREIIVVPSGTFRVAGVITEADSQSIPVAQVRVDVVGNPSVPPATTFGDGRYRLYGVSGPVQIRAEKAGYQPVTQNVVVNDHGTVNLVLPLAAPRLHVSGGYTLTITAADECRQQLPEATWTRRYAATVHQEGPLLRAVLSGASFVLSGQSGNSFGGRVEPSRVLFTLVGGEYYRYYGIYGDLVEQLDESTYFAIAGFATVMGTSDVLDGQLNGDLLILDRDPRRFPAPTKQCRSSQHRFRLSR
jgi:Carboxypeptidase regulatory-like domain